MNNTTLAAALVLAALAFVASLSIIGSRHETEAGHTEEHKQPYLWVRDTIAANVLTGETIDVCTTEYPNATALAVAMWNTSTRAHADSDLFVAHAAQAPCGTADAQSAVQGKVAAIVVGRDDIVERMCPVGALGCLAPVDGWRNGTFEGRMEVRVIGANFGTAADDPRSDYFDNLVVLVAHELGHALGLEHYRCGDTASTQVDSDRNHTTNRPAIMYDNRPKADGTSGVACHVLFYGGIPDRVTDIELADSIIAYYGVPSKPTALQATALNESLRITWEKPRIVRNGDKYQYRLDGENWREMDLSDLQAETFDIEPLTNGQEYVIELRVVRGPVEGGASNPAYGTPRAPVTPVTVVIIAIPTTTISLLADQLTDIIWPGFATRVDIAIDREDRISHAVWYDAANMVWRIYISDGPEFLNTRFILWNGHAYGIWATVAFDWRVNIPAARSGQTGGQSGVSATSEQPGWVATVTCETGLSPFVLGAAPTRTVAEENAQWLIDNPIGCSGDGTYRVAYRGE